MTLIDMYRERGFNTAIRLVRARVGKKFAHFLSIPLWLWFTFRNRGARTTESLPSTDPAQKEGSIRTILARIQNGTFLEVGIGEFPHFERLKLINESSISYVGCDLAAVCASHEVELALKNFNTANVRFAPNTTGTYAWTLFEMLQRGEQYDVIYIDGHHTFYIDLPAILLADRLLKPGGYLLLDDIQWTLSFLKANLKRSLSQWYFYRRIYNFSEYTKEQEMRPHIRMIAEELLLKDGRYVKDEAVSFPHWWALRKSRDS